MISNRRAEAMKNVVRLQATELDVYVNGKRVGTVMDCGDCWRAWLVGRRRLRAFPDYDSRGEAVKALVGIATAP
jgi:hypothetical protein